MKKDLKVEFNLSIFEGSGKRILDRYFGDAIFQQRKNYDEYTVNTTSIIARLDLDDLMRIGNHFDVQVSGYGVLIKQQ